MSVFGTDTYFLAFHLGKEVGTMRVKVITLIGLVVISLCGCNIKKNTVKTVEEESNVAETEQETDTIEETNEYDEEEIATKFARMVSDIDLDRNGTYIEITPVEENTGKSISIHTLDNCKVLNITSNNRVLQLLSDYNEGKIYGFYLNENGDIDGEVKAEINADVDFNQAMTDEEKEDELKNEVATPAKTEETENGTEENSEDGTNDLKREDDLEDLFSYISVEAVDSALVKSDLKTMGKYMENDNDYTDKISDSIIESYQVPIFENMDNIEINEISKDGNGDTLVNITARFSRIGFAGEKEEQQVEIIANDSKDEIESMTIEHNNKKFNLLIKNNNKMNIIFDINRCKEVRPSNILVFTNELLFDDML